MKDLNRRDGGFGSEGGNGPRKRLRKRIIVKRNPSEGGESNAPAPESDEPRKFEKVEYNRPYQPKPYGERTERREGGNYNPNYRRPNNGEGGGNGDRGRGFGGGNNRGGDRQGGGGGFRKPFNKFGGGRDGDNRQGGGFRKPFNKGPRPKFEKKKKVPKEKNKHSYTIQQFQYEEDKEVRLNKFLANAGICSRREADKLIQQGIITINGEVVTELGCRVRPGDVVKYNGQTIGREEYVYLLLNKPKDYISTMSDPEGRKTVMDIMGQATKERIFPVGRLDRNTTGLLLFTNDGDLAQVLTHPKFNVKKVYLAILDKDLAESDMDKLLKGVELEDGLISVDNIAYIQGEKNRIGVEIHSGRNRIIHRMFEHLGYTVDQLDRVFYAGLTKKDLLRGRYRFLNEQEIMELKKFAAQAKEELAIS